MLPCTLRHRLFDDREDRLAGFTIESKQHAGLGRLDHRGNRAAAVLQRHQ
jgi:hypothetical protein